MNFKLANYYIYIPYLISLFFMFFSYKYQLIHPTCCDANSYVDIANQFLNFGIFEKYDSHELRLYGFPLFLSFFYFIFEKENAVLAYTIFNCCSYIVLSILISNKLKENFQLNDKILNMAFGLNLFIFPYLVIPLADGLSILLIMLIIYLLLKIISDLELKNRYLYFILFLYSYIIGFSIMVRPSNISLIILIPLLMIFFYFYKNKKLYIAGLLILGFLIAVAPQLYMNYHHFQKISFLPTIDLGTKQIEWGIQYLKYATNLSGVGTPQMYYKNPFALNYVSGMGISWYFHNLESGFKTVFLHLFNVFSFDYYFPYIYDLYPKYKSLILFYSWFIIFFGILGIFESYKNLNIYVNSKYFREVKILFYIILPSTIMGGLSILAISAVEVRFSLPIVTILMPFVFYSFLKNKLRLKVLSIFILWISCAFIISSFVDLQKNIPYM